MIYIVYLTVEVVKEQVSPAWFWRLLCREIIYEGEPNEILGVFFYFALLIANKSLLRFIHDLQFKPFYSSASQEPGFLNKKKNKILLAFESPSY